MGVVSSSSGEGSWFGVVYAPPSSPTTRRACRGRAGSGRRERPFRRNFVWTQLHDSVQILGFNQVQL